MLAAYAETVAGWLPDTDDPVLVGHSLGAWVIPLVAANRGRQVAQVYLCPVGPILGRSLAEGAAEDEGVATHDPSQGAPFSTTSRRHGSSVRRSAPSITSAALRCNAGIACW